MTKTLKQGSICRKMESEEIFSSNLEERSVENPGLSKQPHLKEKCGTSTIKDNFPTKKNTQRGSLIPKLKINNTNNREIEGAKRKFTKSAKPLNRSSVILNAHEYSGVCQKPVEDKNFKRGDGSSKRSRGKQEIQNRPSSQKLGVRQSPAARRMISVPVFNKVHFENGALSDFENRVRQISEIWLKTSTDLSIALKKLKSKPSLDPMEFQQESIKMQMAVQQAKSLTLLKTKSVMAEAKILLEEGEAIGSELECFLPDETFTFEKDGGSLSGALDESYKKSAEKQKNFGMGDLPRGKDKSAESDYVTEIDGDNLENENSGSQTTRIDKTESFLLREKDETLGSLTDSEGLDAAIKLEKRAQETMNELSKKNETITQLNNKVFQLQKVCEEHAQLRYYLQGKLAEYQEKIQWNHVLWKQIGKLKARIKGFQESHEKLESENKTLRTLVANYEKEIKKVREMNPFFKQKTSSGDPKDFYSKMEADFNEEFAREKLLEEKRNSINLLRMVLNMMVDRESLAQKQIAMFQSKILELEKATVI